MNKRLKRLLSILWIVTVFLFFVPAIAGSLTVNVSIDTNKNLVINGKTSANSYVTVKVLDPYGSIDYLDQTSTGADGIYEFKYSLSGKFEGVYTIYVYSKDVTSPVVKTVSYTTSQSSGTGATIILPSSPATSQQQQTQTQLQGQNQQQQQQQTQPMQVTVIKPQVETNGQVAVSKVDEKTLSQAVASAKINEKGEKVIEISVEAKGNVNEYEQVIPVKSVSGQNVVFNISTNVGQVKVPADVISSGVKVENLSVAVGKLTSDKLAEVKQTIGKNVELALKVEVKADGKVLSGDSIQKPIIVSSKYTPSIGVNTKYLAVMKVKEDGTVEPVASGMYFADSKVVAFRAKDSAKYVVVENHKTFEDIKDVSWAKEPVEVLASKGIVKGVNEKNFAPQKQITRADFLLLLVRALELNAQVKDNFNDVLPSDYYYEAAGVAKALGIVNGVGNGKFNPKGFITRQDMIVMADRALKIAGYKYSSSIKSIDTYVDASKVSNYAKESIQKFVSEGFIQGSNNSLKPTDNASRAEVAIIVYRLINSYYTQQLK
ncbi:S-layer homology domain-containing protein [Anaerocellum diazotrophicum]|uniref:SLH domain-containing protein n=1 Tax=Caldicellulosiruptor diazotrophicus TaxID=2806205 RepID=A0ABM7NJ96_9FIRM|nr:S-layer homology domain-containing protein [Caldicellulosiruptor diazotrophicus]BCS80169.1 hypothetical protein CaldiYA01_01290 [Caldicellulosiruptor diazotrophicus]